MKDQFTTQVKVGIFVFLGLIIAFYFTFKLGKYGEKIGGYKIYAVFDNAYGVVRETPVYIAGIQVGYVEEKRLKDTKAVVEMRIFEKNKIPKNSIAFIRMRGLLGDKYVDIKPGDPETGFLKDGDFIERTEVPLDIEALSSKLSEVADNLTAITASLRGALGTEEAQKSLSDIVRDMRNFIAQLSERMDRNAGKIDAIITDLKEVAGYLRERTPALSDKIEKAADELSGIIEDSRENARQAVASLKNAAEDASDSLRRAKEIIKKIEEGEGIMGKLISDKELGKKFEKTVSAFSESLEASSRLSIDLLYRGEFDPTGNIGHKNFFGVKLSPRPGKFYLFEVGTVPELVEDETIITETVNGSSTTIRRTVLSRKVKFSLQIGRTFNFLTLRGGLIQSTGGFGVDFSLFKDYITLTFDAYDFTRKTNPALKAGLDITLYRYFYLYGGVDDMINYQMNQRYFIGGGIRLTDDDLRRLLGLAATAAVAGGY